jgi:hypothetical protein
MDLCHLHDLNHDYGYDNNHMTSHPLERGVVVLLNLFDQL